MAMSCAVRTRAALGVALLLEACGPDDAIRVGVDFDWSIEREDTDSRALRSLRGSGVIVVSAPPIGDDLAREAGRSTLYAELSAFEQALGVLEIAYARGTIPNIRYREIARGEIVFQAKIIESDVRIPEIGSETWHDGEFSFVAVPAGSAGEGPKYRSKGRVVRLDGSPSAVVEIGGADWGDGLGRWVDPRMDWGGDPAESGGRESVPAAEPPPSTPQEAPVDAGSRIDTGDDDPDVRVDIAVPVEVDLGGGCEGDEPPSGGGAGSSCEGEPTSDEGCGGDAGGAEGAGCEGDHSSSSCDGGGSGCSGCEGDVAGTALPPTSDRAGRVGLRRAAASTFRLVWPVGLAAWINRRARARLRLQAPREETESGVQWDSAGEGGGLTSRRDAEVTTTVPASQSWAARERRSTMSQR